MIKRIILLRGKAKQVFRFLELAARFRGEKTLGDLAAFDEWTARQEIKSKGSRPINERGQYLRGGYNYVTN